jgi:hypothetical protein
MANKFHIPEELVKHENTKSSDASVGTRFYIGLAILLIIGAGVTVVTIYNGYLHPEQYKELGAWGDFTGGLLNPILTFLTFVGVLITIVLQRIELALTRSEMSRSADALEAQDRSLARQRFEATFFEMMKLQNEIISGIDLIAADGSRETKGRDCFKIFYTRLTKIYRENLEKSKGRYSKEKVLELSYRIFWKQHQLELGHYFRFLFNFFRLISNSDSAEPYHAKLLRSQLSNQELLLQYYNCLSKNGEKFIEYAKQFAIFDNLPVVRLLDKQHASLLPKEVFGDNPMIFNPGLQDPI